MIACDFKNQYPNHSFHQADRSHFPHQLVQSTANQCCMLWVALSVTAVAYISTYSSPNCQTNCKWKYFCTPFSCFPCSQHLPMPLNI